MKRVVITGLGTVNPLGSTVEKFWENVKKGTLGVSKIDSFDTTELGVSVAGIIRDFDPAEYFERKDIRHMERFTQIAVASAIQALQDAGTDFKDMDPYRVGTIIGCGIGGIGRIEEEHDKYRAKGPGRISPFFVPMMIGNMAAGQVAIRTGFRGDNFCTTTACASATHAIGEAQNQGRLSGRLSLRRQRIHHYRIYTGRLPYHEGTDYRERSDKGFHPVRPEPRRLCTG